MLSEMSAADLAALQEDELYSALYYIVEASIESEWDTGEFTFSILGIGAHRYAVSGYFEGERVFGDPPREARQDARVVFDELARRMELAGHPPWRAARFETTREGQMTMHFTYPDEDSAPSDS